MGDVYFPDLLVSRGERGFLAVGISADMAVLCGAWGDYMSAFQIPKTFPLHVGKHTSRVNSSEYTHFIHLLPCVVTGAAAVQAAHVSFANLSLGAPGRGKGAKVSDRWLLPLHPNEHAEQHSGNEREYWIRKRINPHLVCLVLWGMWNERGHEAVSVLSKMLRSGLPQLSWDMQEVTPK